ncbi:MAG: transmembrane 220 family protein [Williamsia sp.]|nr:transmembrane 220 family protein [Williamsia sp.]
MKAFNIIFIVLFVLFAALQYNDPDPYIWIPIYLYAAYLCYRALKKQYPRGLYIAGLVVYGAYAMYLLFDKTGVLNWAEVHHAENIVQTMKAEKPWIEETREFGGLLIVIIVLLVNMRWLSKSKGGHTYNVE